MTQPIVLCIMDGVGISQNSAHNAVKMAKMPFLTPVARPSDCQMAPWEIPKLGI